MGDTTYECILALAADDSATNNLQERMLQEKLQAESKLIESTATPCERFHVDGGECPKTAAKLYSGQGEHKRDEQHTSRCFNAVNLDHQMDNMPNNSVILRNPSACAMENHDDDEGFTNDSSKRVVKTYCRKRKKAYDYPMADSKSIHEHTGSLVQESLRKSSSDHAVQMFSGSCSNDLSEKRLVEGVVEDLLVEKVVHGCTDVETIGVENERIMDTDNSKGKTTEGCLNKDMPLVDGAKQHFEQCGSVKPDNMMDMQGNYIISHVAKEVDDESGRIVSDEYVDKPSIPSLSDSSNLRYATSQVDKYMNRSLGRSLIGSSRKKLLVLDINGLLADIVCIPHIGCTSDAIIAGKAVFKRPFCDDFLQFCFARFSVGVWSSRMKRNVELIIDFLMGDSKKELLFCWDQYHCTDTGFNTVENREKPLLVKKLKKLWEKYERNLPWERGEYNETNTLLLDDSPHKALGNPPHTAIFPLSYQYSDEDDNSLGPGGALRLYLEGLANAENVQKYVKENPFGQRPITEKNLSWRFYRKVIDAISSTSRDTPDRYSRASYHWQAYR